MTTIGAVDKHHFNPAQSTSATYTVSHTDPIGHVCTITAMARQVILLIDHLHRFVSHIVIYI